MFFSEALHWQPKEPMQRRRCSERLNELPSWSWAGWEGEIEQLEWLQHWRDLGSISALASMSRSPVLRLSPLVAWFYGTKLEERFPVKIPGKKYIKTHVEHSTKIIPLPTKRPRLGDDQYVYDNQENTRSAYPLPERTDQVPGLISARYLFCRTSRAYFKSKLPFFSGEFAAQAALPQLSTLLQDKDRYLVGHLNLNLSLMEFKEPRNNTKYELVAISSGALDYSAAPIWMLSDGQLWQASAWKNNRDRNVVDFYSVLWIEWSNGIAYRKGLGRVLKEAWDREVTEEIDLILG
jgi:hypothetical protein